MEVSIDKGDNYWKTAGVLVPFSFFIYFVWFFGQNAK